MGAKTQVYLWAAILFLLGSTTIFYKYQHMGFPLSPGQQSDVWVIEALIEFQAAERPVKTTFSIPGHFGKYEVLDENSASSGYGFTRIGEEGRQSAQWTIRNAQGPQKIYYNFSIYDAGSIRNTTDINPTSEIPYFDASHRAVINSVIDDAWNKSADIKTFTREIIRRMGTNDQVTNLLKTLLNDEYRRPHLIRDLITLKGLKAVVVRGLALQDGRRKAHAEPFLAIYDKDWRIVDLGSGDYIDRSSMIFWRTGSMLEVEGGSRSRVSFSMIRSQQSAQALAARHNLDEEHPLITFSIYALPVEFQTLFRLLLLIPVGCLIVVIMRNLVGLSTSGTFMPVLLAMAFIETTLSKGLIVLLVILALGLILRNYLSRMNLLLVPRISAVVICVVLLMAVISVISFKLGINEGVSVTLFPMIIISWTIERASILWEEHGGMEVFTQMGGSLAVSIIVYFVMTNTFVKYFTFTFPESMLLLLAFVLIIGTYTGYRLTELFRFEPLVQDED